MTDNQANSSYPPPNREGVYWAALDDGERVVEVALLRVTPYRGTASLQEGAVVTFVDSSRRDFTMQSIDQRIVRPGRDIILASAGRSLGDELRITWLARVEPGPHMPRVGDEPLWDTQGVPDWPDPDALGVPLQADRDGAHLVAGATGNPRGGAWTLLWNSIERYWVDLYGNLVPPAEAARLVRYIGPCTAPMPSGEPALPRVSPKQDRAPRL